MEDERVAIDTTKMRIDFEKFGLDPKAFVVDMNRPRVDTAFITPRISAPKTVLYENAVGLAKNIKIEKNMNLFAIIDGSFIFGDFWEALIETHELRLKTFYVSTLGMNENNVDSLVNLIELYHVPAIKLIISHYFYSVERNNLVAYLLNEVKGLNFQVAVAGSHCKTCILETKEGLYLTAQGSANLSSNQNIEQFSLTENRELYEFNKKVLDIILENHSILDMDKNLSFKKAKKSRGKALWEEIKNARDVR